jgi:uncharacterized protein (DUF302 family)
MSNIETFTSNLGIENVISKLLSAINNQNMRVVAHINGQANAAKMGKEVPADQILEIFRPDLAIRVWEACKPAGYDIPLRIHIYEEGNMVRVAWRKPSDVFAPFGNTGLDVIAVELDEIFNHILGEIMAD